jgi:hypothetical protein
MACHKLILVQNYSLIRQLVCVWLGDDGGWDGAIPDLVLFGYKTTGAVPERIGKSSTDSVIVRCCLPALELAVRSSPGWGQGLSSWHPCLPRAGAREGEGRACHILVFPVHEHVAASSRRHGAAQRSSEWCNA